MDEEDIREIIVDFIAEASESIEQMEQDFVVLEADSQNKECLQRIFRHLHTIKGTANFLELKPNFDKMGKIAHAAEDLLDALRSSKLELTSEIMDTILQTTDIIKSLFESEKQEVTSDVDENSIIAKLRNILLAEDDNAAETDKVDMAELGSGLDADDIAEITIDFIIEATEMLQKMDQDLIILEAEPQNKECLQRIFRYLHTIKGTANFLESKPNFDKIGKVAHVAEDLLDALRSQKIEVTPQIMDTILQATDIIKSLFDYEKNRTTSPMNIDQIITALHNCLEVKVVSSKETVETQRNISLQNLVKIPMINPDKLGDHSPGNTQRRTSSFLKVDSNIRVDTERLDSLMNLVGELVLGRNRLLQIVKKFEDIITDDVSRKKNASLDDKVDLLQHSRQELSAASDFIHFVTSELQTAVLKTRMQPIGKIFNRFTRTVRDLARDLSKKVRLVIEGAETELDKTVIEEIGDPLTHLLRNAVDHGIETIEAREKKGKTAEGTIHLSAYHEGNHIIICIKDDGGGINPSKVKEKAIKMGVISSSDAEHLPTQNIINLIFMPGFSTAGEVTNISGRGIGMDVVKSNIEKLNGTIEISSEVGIGSVFTIRLPLTLAILQALKINVGNEIFAIPLTSVIETIRIYSHQIETVSGHEVIRFRKNIIPLVRMSFLFALPESENTSDKLYIVITGVGDQKIGLVVDRILDQQEIVIKPLGNLLDKTPGISGASLAGDGKVILILDLAALIRTLPQQINLGMVKHRLRQEELSKEKNRRRTILVVEDSRNERKRICKLLNQDFKVVEAQDGRDALGQLDNYKVDLIITDIEMPDIDGYEFVRKVKMNRAYRDIPVIIVSSHREMVNRIKGMEVGIDGYFGKPFNEKDLVTTIHNLLVSRE